MDAAVAHEHHSREVLIGEERVEPVGVQMTAAHALEPSERATQQAGEPGGSAYHHLMASTPRDRLSRVSLIPVAPKVYRQGRELKRTTPRLPDAARPWTGTVAGDDPLRILVFGDSTAAGVGAETQDAALPGNLARTLAARYGRGVSWRAVGENGATTRILLDRYLVDALAEPADLVFLSIGANDALGIRSRAAYTRDLGRLLDGVAAGEPGGDGARVIHARLRPVRPAARAAARTAVPARPGARAGGPRA